MPNIITTSSPLSPARAKLYGQDLDGNNGVFTPFSSSPRDTQRLAGERSPVVLIDRTYPNCGCSHKIVWAAGNTLYGYGVDYSLRKSTDRGASWSKALSNSSALARWARAGLFLKTSAGSLITTSHPSDLSAPKIIRSVDDGLNWSDVVAAQTDVDYLGSTSICQDPITGYIYLAEYVIATAAAKATWKIIRSVDDGATWATFKTFQRDSTAYPSTAVRHGHAVQWDQFSERVYFLTGDSEQSAGVYRVNAGGTDVEKVLFNSETTGGNVATAVGMMFFPTHIAWGMDATSDSWLMRLHRDKIGSAVNTDLEQIGRLQSTSWHGGRVLADGTEWIMSVSNEVSVGRVDAAVHLYRVADNGATMDEIMTIPTPNTSSIYSAYAVGSPLQSNNEGVLWMGTNVATQFSGFGTLAGGQQFSAIIGWGKNALHQTNTDRLPYSLPITQSSGNVSLSALEKKYFGVTEAPVGCTRLYILDVGREQFSGTGLFYVEVWSVSGAAVLKMEDGTTDMQWQNRSLRAVKNEATAPYIFRSAGLSPGTQLRFRLNEILNNTAEGAAYITYAWGL